MIEQDTVRLMRECDAGIKMGVKSIDEVLGHVRNEDMKGILRDSRREHERLQKEITARLDAFGENGKAPNVMAKGMSSLKTNMMIAMEESDATIADLMTDGCDMGVKSLAKYLNQYAAASEEAKDYAKRLIEMEESLAVKMRDYL